MKLTLLLTLILFVSCKSLRNWKEGNKQVKNFQAIYTAGPQTLVYKTKKDYSKLVPVLLNDEKTAIVSFPDPKDMRVGENFSTPTLLQKNYLLDNRGINQNVAFLKYTYEEYAAFEKTPNSEELFKQIIDLDPLAELCDCGNKTAFTDPEKQLNLIISRKDLQKKCKVVK